MAMSRRDFEGLAAIVAKVPGQGCGPEWLAAQLADYCATRNDLFDRERFIAAALDNGGK